MKGARPRRYLFVAIGIPLVVWCVLGVVACEPGGGDSENTQTTSGIGDDGSEAGDVEGYVGQAIDLGRAVVTVRALQATFQPAMPEQRLSEEAPTAPSSGESFYQAYVRVENTAVSPIRVDPYDFACAVGTVVVGIEPTRSGPFSRSLLLNASLDLLLTFKAQAGYEAMLLYSPPWYDGVIRVSPQSEATGDS